MNCDIEKIVLTRESRIYINLYFLEKERLLLCQMRITSRKNTSAINHDENALKQDPNNSDLLRLQSGLKQLLALLSPGEDTNESGSVENKHERVSPSRLEAPCERLPAISSSGVKLGYWEKHTRHRQTDQGPGMEGRVETSHGQTVSPGQGIILVHGHEGEVWGQPRPVSSAGGVREAAITGHNDLK